MGKERKELSAKQRAFISFYLLTFNATKSAKLAQYKGNENTLSSIGYENLRKREIREEIEERLKTHVMGPAECLAHLANISRDYENPGQLRALELICKHLQLFEDRHRLTVSTINLDQLSDSQIKRIANGEDYLAVMENKL